jgi:hypothetical protein
VAHLVAHFVRVLSPSAVTATLASWREIRLISSLNTLAMFGIMAPLMFPIKYAYGAGVRIPVKSATHSDFGRTLNPVISDTYRSVATLVV